MTNHVPRHKGRVAPDSVRQGPERWIRAALNAAIKPNSKAARLYQARVANAHAVASLSLTNRPWESRRKNWDCATVVARPTKRAYAMCSDYCAVMQVQLDFSTTDLKAITDVFDKGMGQFRGVVSFSGDRVVRCQVCAGPVRPIREG